MLLRPSGFVTLTTDFGAADPYVGILKGAIFRASTKVQVLDLGHEIAPQDVASAAFFAWSAVGRFPPGTVHVAVVDPGVGTSRRILCAAAHECYWLAPDNGLLGAVLRTAPTADVRAVDAEHLGIRPESRTFHGRDVFAPVAAWLAAGRYGFSALGPRVDDWRTEDLVFEGTERVVHVDRFGNLISNVRATTLSSGTGVEVGGRHVPWHGTYADVGPDELLAYVGSFGLVEVGARNGSAAGVLGLGRGAPFTVVPA